jgi:signal transduction histidine kinase
LDKALAAPPDTILLDVMMPKLDGYEVCRRLRQNPRTAHVPVLLVTALTERTDRLTGIRAGANDFLTKPIDAEDLRLRVRNAVSAKGLYDRVQENYRRLQQLEELRDGLTHMIVHDIRSPLMVAQWAFELVLGQPGALDATQKEYLTHGSKACEQMIQMVNSLLDVSRMEAGQMPLHREPCDLRELARRAAESVAVLAVDKGLSTEVSGESVSCPADRDLLHRVLVNLLGNAIQHSPRARNVRVGVSAANGVARVTVRDEGEGIPPEYHQRIFEKFGQVEARKERKKYSSGLGLTFCKLAVEAHGGRIGVESEVEQGSLFWFEVPLTPP